VTAASDWAESGIVALTGYADGPPMVPPGRGASMAREAERAFLAMTESRSVPRGWHRLLGERAAITGAVRRAPWSVGGSCRAVRANDGWVAMSLARPCDVLSVAALVESDRDLGSTEAAWLAIDGWALDRSRVETVARAELLGIPCGEIPDGSTPTRGTAARWIDVVEGESPEEERPPLVVDLSALWAGPLCAHLLGAAGASVVKVELPARLDGARDGDPDFYRLLHAGHDSVVVDLALDADRELLQRLCERADIVISACRPRAWASLGLFPYEICRRTPTTWVSITAYGLEQGDRVGFGDDVAMAAGLVVWGDGGRPLPCGDAIADPLAGMHAAVDALGSYRIGGSRVLDVSMRDVVAATMVGPAVATPVVERGEGGGWLLKHRARDSVVEAPVRRDPAGVAAPPGRDTERWRRQL
jgi:hypothetical protein